MPTPPPLSPVPTRRLPAWLKVVGISIGALLLTAIIGIVAAYSFIFSLFEPAPAPHGWRNVSAKHSPQDNAFLGTWRPGELGRTIPFADGTPHTLEPDDALTLLPDHTYHFTRRGIYDGRSRLLCLRSETGRWAIRPQPGDHPPQLSLVADTPSIRIEHRVIPDLNMDNVNYNDLEQQHKSPGSPSINPQDPKSIDDQTNAMNCSSSFTARPHRRLEHRHPPRPARHLPQRSSRGLQFRCPSRPGHSHRPDSLPA